MPAARRRRLGLPQLKRHACRPLRGSRPPALARRRGSRDPGDVGVRLVVQVIQHPRQPQPGRVYEGRIEFVVWSIPALTVILLGGVIWIGSHQLDPRAPIPGQSDPLRVDVVALDWKWLFIYPIRESLCSASEEISHVRSRSCCSGGGQEVFWVWILKGTSCAISRGASSHASRWRRSQRQSCSRCGSRQPGVVGAAHWISHAREKISPLVGISESDQTISVEKP